MIFDLKNIFKNQCSFDFNSIGSVALIGSSGILLDNEYGGLIDSHNTIIRFNRAPTLEYEKNVGSKTTIRILNGPTFASTIHPPERFSQYDPDFIPSLRGEHFFIKGYNMEEFYKGVLANLNKNYINFISDSYIKYCSSFIGNHTSVGFIGLLLSVTYSDNISVFGFDHGEIENEKRHYWESVIPGKMHSFDTEKSIFVEYEKQNLIKIYK